MTNIADPSSTGFSECAQAALEELIESYEERQRELEAEVRRLRDALGVNAGADACSAETPPMPQVLLPQVSETVPPVLPQVLPQVPETLPQVPETAMEATVPVAVTPEPWGVPEAVMLLQTVVAAPRARPAASRPVAVPPGLDDCVEVDDDVDYDEGRGADFLTQLQARFGNPFQRAEVQAGYDNEDDDLPDDSEIPDDLVPSPARRILVLAIPAVLLLLVAGLGLVSRGSGPVAAALSARVASEDEAARARAYQSMNEDEGRAVLTASSSATARERPRAVRQRAYRNKTGRR
ncbi:MAG: hypothetical protein HY903_23115 [Deltaproteobacteria bacterium]|nr:hypothetical protein [Deltaproteobacteria bacterium]